jgi:hypothetical protein
MLRTLMASAQPLETLHAKGMAAWANTKITLLAGDNVPRKLG